jgi:signal transduction histidine kinase
LALATRLLIFPAVAALGMYAEWAALRRAPLEPPATRHEVLLAAADLVAGLVLVACGVVAWVRRPESRTGLLLTIAGVAWFLGTFSASGDATYADTGALFVALHRGPLVHALLSYPTGRVERPLERSAVALAYVASALPEVGDWPPVQLALAAVVLGVGVQRARTAAGPLRRARVVAALAAGAFAAVLAGAATIRLAESSASVDRGALWAYDTAVAAIAIALALDLVLGRWVRSAVTGLVVDLGELPEAAPLRDRLAEALGDRSLVVGYWLTDRGVYVDDRGGEVGLPEGGGERRVTFVADDGDRLAVLVHDAAVSADPELLESVAAAARIAVVNARLQAEVRSQLEDLDASRRRLLEAGDAERGRLERELREGAERRLARIGELLDRAGPGADGRLAELRAKLDATQSELREFARGVHPRTLTEGGLGLALGELADSSPVRVDVRARDARFPPAVEAAAYFVCSESLANVVKHAGASHVTIDVASRSGALVVSVTDDGRGGAELGAGSGLRGLADRVQALGGRLTVTSPTGEGTRLVAELPLM